MRAEHYLLLLAMLLLPRSAMGVCRLLLTAGQLCTAGAECGTGLCVDGVCCGTACDGVCESCNLPGSAGECKAIPDATDPYAECGARTCDGARACRPVGARDAGTDGGARVDGGRTVDAAVGLDGGTTTPPETRGGCSAGGSSAGGHRALPLGLALALWVAIRRRRSRAGLNGRV